MLKAADRRRLTLIRRLCSSADKMYTEIARLVTELATAPRVTKSAAEGLKRIRARARTPSRRRTR